MGDFVRLVNNPNREKDLLELPLRGLESFVRPVPTLASNGGMSLVRRTSAGRGRNEFTGPGFGEGKRDGLTDNVEALEGERARVDRGIEGASSRVSGLEINLS